MVGAAYAVLGASTRPFTVGADVVTAVPLALAVLVAVGRGRHRALPVGVPHRAPDTFSWRWAPYGLLWGVGALAVVSWELYCYFNTPRARYPTLSVLVNMLNATPVGKTAAFAAWLALGCFLVLG